MPDLAVLARGLVHRYPRREALRGVDFTVAPGELFAVLGPNGGGKSTLFRILSTMIPATGGTVRILGRDPLRESAAVRRDLGVVFQAPALDRMLTVRENLLHQGHLYGLRGKALDGRIDAAAATLRVRDRLGDRAGELSGGMRRRVEIARAFLHRPRLLILDEPTTGLDPAARADVWEHLRGLRREEGITVAFTTHLMDEADASSRVLILDEGRVVALDDPRALKARVPGDVVTIDAVDPEALAGRMRAEGEAAVTVVGGRVRVETPDGPGLAGRLLGGSDASVRSVTVGRPTLEDVFLDLTGHRLAEGAA